MDDYVLQRLNIVSMDNKQETTPAMSGNIDDSQLKAQIKKEVLNHLTESKTEQTDLEFFILQILKQKYPYLTQIQINSIIKDIINDINGLGPIQPLLEDPTINEIMINRYDKIWIEKEGKLRLTDIKFESEEELRKVVDKILLPLGRRVDETQPFVNARLKDKSRVNIVIPPISPDGTTMCIRKFSTKTFTLEDYISLNSMSQEMAQFLKACVIARKNIIVSGGTGSGKTTLLNCLSQYIPEDEAIITIEDNLELNFKHPCVRSLEARGKNAEGKGEITIRDLLINALRMRPDRIIIGECRSVEVIDMLQAMNTGHDGSLTTVHANSPEDMIERLYVMYLTGAPNVPEKAVKSQIALAVDIIVQIARLKTGERKIMEISEVIGIGPKGVKKNNRYVQKKGLEEKFIIDENIISETDIILQRIFKYDIYKNKFKWTGFIPTFYDDLIRRELLPEGFFTVRREQNKKQDDNKIEQVSAKNEITNSVKTKQKKDDRKDLKQQHFRHSESVKTVNVEVEVQEVDINNKQEQKLNTNNNNVNSLFKIEEVS